MPPSAFSVDPTIRTKTPASPVTATIITTTITPAIVTKSYKISENILQEEDTKRRTNQNNNCLSALNYNYTATRAATTITTTLSDSVCQQQHLHNMVLQSYENYATYHLPAHTHAHTHQQQQRINNQYQQQQQHQHQQHYEQHHEQLLSQQQQQQQAQQQQQHFQQNAVYQQQQQTQNPHISTQQQRLSSGSSASSSASTASSIVGSSTAASLGIGYFNELSSFVSSDFTATHHHPASNLYYTDTDANFFSQGKNK